MKLHRVIVGVVSSLIIAATSNAQAQNAGDSVPELNDLVNVRGRDGEVQLQQRGYIYRWAESSDDAVYSYWTQSSTGQCITVRTEQGRYVSLAYTGGSADCDRGDPPTVSNTSPPALQDMVGARAGQAEAELQRRGYSYRRNERISNAAVASFWIEGNSGQCVEIVTSDGRYKDIYYVNWHHCEN
ncbi:hypothetical protein [Nodosilinea nodulosa]|uniref:hypothetical protein n=1 Tax=Nodosilinea nodulosa TaxID=416001 RepID=UPI000310A3F1|nr:hypothetical protein [Nodosilinea nodulosa]